jgi:hypothetical protein
MNDLAKLLYEFSQNIDENEDIIDNFLKELSKIYEENDQSTLSPEHNKIIEKVYDMLENS